MKTNSRFHWWTSLALALTSGVMAIGFHRSGQPWASVPRPAEDRGVLRVAYSQDLLPDLHRRLFPLPQFNQLMLSLWEPLIECDPATNRPRPAAAESWAWSADRLTLTLTLRPDARWSNGDPVTAPDFVRGWLRLLRQKTDVAATLFPLRNAEAYHRGTLEDPRLLGLQALDDHTLQLSVDRPRSTLVVELADPLLSPLHPTSEAVFASKAYFPTPTALVTNGPFRLVKADADGFRLEANHYYHDSAGVALTGIQFVRADDPSLTPLMIAAGVVDLLSPAPFGENLQVPTDRRTKSEDELELAITSLDFNLTRGPQRDIRVRQALALALDRAGTIQKYDPRRLVAARSWVPSMPGRPGLVLLQEDAAEARRLLAAAGYPGGKGFPVLRMVLPLWMERDPYPSAWSERWFQELGIRTYIAYDAPRQRTTRMVAGDYDVLCNFLTATVPDAGDLLAAFLWPPDRSGTKWRNAEVTALLNQADTKSGEERLAALEEAERKIMAAVPSIPVMFERRRTMLADEVKGWYPDPLGRQALRRLWLDLPAARKPAVIPAL